MSALALSACSGGNLASTPGAGMSGQSLGAQHVAGEKHITTQMVRTNAPVCKPIDNLGCFSDSLKHGLVISWCYGPTSDPCEDTDTITWSGGIVTNNAKQHAIGKSKMKATWTGPFPCTSSTCNSSGSYELDTITNGPDLTKTAKYKYGQQLCIDSSCGSYLIGINVKK
ncbi:MAG: hypothetical protein WB615_02600 [Candidatus Tumulicola sp.]